ncbi:LD-carboxypeptidase [Synechococcus sp. UW179A]|uniref:S66 peptidase family protein n=1 Tax=Synechococcus sp. UW179A TaxID=2575510 RepID=UPI000E0EB3C6|nr:LD-carboxypeptidase [Synechococcus sp. UW179A]
MPQSEHLWSLPSPLKVGDRVNIAAPSSAICDETSLLAGIAVLKSWGLTVNTPTCHGRHWGYLAGRDSERSSDLSADAGVALLACARGGWGAARLLEQAVPWRKGWFLGFSDVTALLCSRMASGFGGGIHGPLVTTLASEPNWSQQRLHDLLFGHPVASLQGTCWAGGVGIGPLLTVNLTVASHLLGSRHLPDLRGAILVIEDVGEAPYRLDRMLTHWRLVGALQDLEGIGFGRFSGCDDAEQSESEHTFSLEQVLRERTQDLGCPVVADLPVGHGNGGNAALPMGVLAQLDGNSGTLSLELPTHR